jgi:hypothetical protein
MAAAIIFVQIKIDSFIISKSLRIFKQLKKLIKFVRFLWPSAALPDFSSPPSFHV